MPKRKDINSVLVIGAGPIVIGQACEFDYSGTQACQTLKQEGIRVVLLNSNPATIMTDTDMADATYIEPINVETASAIIKNEKVDAVLPTMGGQTALNCAMELFELGIFSEDPALGPILIGAKADSIKKAEDRSAFKEAMEKIGLKSAPSVVVQDFQTAQEVVSEKFNFPVVLRPSFTLGGSGGGIVYNQEEFNTMIAHALSESPTQTVLIEQSLIGWKEFEMEVVRDAKDNSIIVCSIENFDPMGVHTGDSITVAPAQTLTDKEFQQMRNYSIAILREIGVDTGGANVQFAVNPKNGEILVIEMNPRVSRSSALASKATGFPIAKVATKIAIGYTLDEISNDITDGKTPASFEPSIDYIVTKIPRFDFEKFTPTVDRLNTQMRSVGEAMGIGRTFAESLQKTLCSMEFNYSILGLCYSRLKNKASFYFDLSASKEDEIENEIENLKENLSNPHSRRIFDIGDAFRLQVSLEKIHHLTHIDPWFLQEIKDIIDIEKQIALAMASEENRSKITVDTLQDWKRMGFSDFAIGSFFPPKGYEWVRALRKQYQLHPVYKRIDTCAGEFATNTSYLYSTYEQECELSPSNKKKVIILGSGPNRIGQGIEFDYCCVHGIMALKKLGYETIMINCNPETVSTDYDIADRLFFEPLTAEHVIEIATREQAEGIIVQFGGQTPLSIAKELVDANFTILGTSVDSIDQAESRYRFQKLIQEMGLKQPPNAIVNCEDIAPDVVMEHVLQTAAEIGYPLVVRPSYVLGGRAMKIVHNVDQMQDYLFEHIRLFSRDLLLDKFLEDAIEVDVDALCDQHGQCVIAGVMEHIERAGVHSGDSACSLPPFSLPEEIISVIKKQTQQLGEALNVVGLMNVQFAVQGSDVYILELNPRASRTIPFISKSIGVPIAKMATDLIVGRSLNDSQLSIPIDSPKYYTVKEAVFPFNKFPEVDTLLGPEMRSTGESMGIGEDFDIAFFLSQEAISHLPKSGIVLFSIRDEDKPICLPYAKQLETLGFTLFATRGTANYFRDNGLEVETMNKVKEGRPHIVDIILSNRAQMVINTEGNNYSNRMDSFQIRHAALTNKVIYFTTMAGTAGLVRALSRISSRGHPVPRPLQSWYQKSREER